MRRIPLSRCSATTVSRSPRYGLPLLPPAKNTKPVRFGPLYSPGRFRENNASFASLAMMAFRLKHDYEMECPSWTLSTYFNINATLPEGATKDGLPIMIQHLLEDRFGLKYHHETRQMAGYELVVAKSGPRVGKIGHRHGPVNGEWIPGLTGLS